MFYTLFFYCWLQPALAQEEVDYSLAKKHFQQGQTLFERGQYAEAAIHFDKAYQITKDPIVLSSLAWAQELSGDIKGTISTLELYLPAAPEAEKSKIEQRLSSLRERLPQEPPPKEESSVVTQPTLTPAVEKKSIWLQNTMWGVSTASAVLATVFGLQAHSARKNLSTLCIDSYCPAAAQPLVQKDQTYSRLADVCWTLSLGTAGTGLWMTLSGDKTVSLHGRF